MSGRETIASLKKTHAEERRNMMRHMGLPEAWGGDPAGIERFLGHVHRQLENIIINTEGRHLKIRLNVLLSECQRVREFAYGYATALDPEENPE